MKKILVLGKYYYPFRGGIEENTRVVAEALSDKYQVEVVAFSHGDEYGDEVINGVKVIRCRTAIKAASQPISFEYIRALARTDADVIHLHAPNFWALPFLAIRLLTAGNRRPRLVVTHHMEVYGRRALRAALIPLYRWVCRRADCVIVTSGRNAEISRDLPRDVPLSVVPLGVDTKSAYVPEARTGALTSKGPRIRFGFVGRHARYKGLEILVHASRLVKVDFEVLIAGEGEQTPVLIKLANELGVSDRVKFVGRLSDEEKVAFMHSLDVFVFPSTEVTEAFGISLLEALSLGLPVIASALPTGVSDLAIHEITALTVEPKNVNELAAAMNRIAQDGLLRVGLSKKAREHAVQHFDDAVVVAKAIAAITGQTVAHQ
jgi:rhamnosyl/mannosyltransferase